MIGVYRPGSLFADALAPLQLGAPQRAHRPRVDRRRGPAPARAHRRRATSPAASSRTSTGCWRREPAAAPTGLLVVDDDVRLPRAFLDRFVAVCEAFGLDLAQPAQTLRSHSAWKVTRQAARIARARDALRRDRARSPRSAGAQPPSCSRSPSFATAGGSTSTGRRSRASAAGGSASSTRSPSATSPGSSPRPIRARTRSAEAARFLADRPYLPSVRSRRGARRPPAGRGAEHAPPVRLPRHGHRVAPSATGRRLIARSPSAASTLKLLALAGRGPFFDEVVARGVAAECLDLRRRTDPRGLRRALAVAATFGPDAVVTRGVSGQLVGEAIARRADAGRAHVYNEHTPLTPSGRLVPPRPHQRALTRLSRGRSTRSSRSPSGRCRRSRRSAIRAGASRSCRTASSRATSRASSPRTSWRATASRPSACPACGRRSGSTCSSRRVGAARARAPGIRGYVAGEGPERARLEPLAAANGVTLLGARARRARAGRRRRRGLPAERGGGDAA